MGTLKFFKKYNIPITEFILNKDVNGNKSYYFITKNDGKKWQTENRILDYSEKNQLGINFQYIHNNKIILDDKYKIIAIDIDIKHDTKNDTKEALLNKIKVVIEKSNYCYEISQSGSGIHVFFIVDKTFEELLAKNNFYIKKKYKSNELKNVKHVNGIDIFWMHGYIHISGEPDWSKLFKNNSLSPISTDDLFNFLLFISTNLNIDLYSKRVINKNSLQKNSIKNDHKWNDIPKINYKTFAEYKKEYSSIQHFLSNQLSEGERHSYLYDNYIPHIYYIYGEFNQFISDCFSHGCSEQGEQFKTLTNDKNFKEVCETLKKFLMYKKEFNIKKTMHKEFEKLKQKYNIEFGSINGINNLKEMCRITDDYHVKYVDYEWIRNQLLYSLKKYNLTKDELKNFFRIYKNILESEITSHITKTDNSSFCNGILFKNGFFNLNTLVFSEKKENSLVKFNFNYIDNPLSESKNFLNFISKFNDVIGVPEVAEAILFNILDFNSDKRFMIILESKQGKGKTWFMNFINRLLSNYSCSIEYNHVIDGKELYKASNHILLCDNDISKKQIYEVSYLKKIITGDKLSVKKLYVDPFEIRSIATFMFCSNHRIKLSGATTTSDGINRRTLSIVWKNQLFPSNKTPEYYIKNNFLNTDIRQEFICGILKLLMNRKNNMKKIHKTSSDQEILFKTKDYQSIIFNSTVNNIIETIKQSGDIEEYIEHFNKNFADKIDKNNESKFKVLKTDFYSHYVDWCHKNRQNPLGKQSFNQKLEDDFNFIGNNQDTITLKNDKKLTRQRTWKYNFTLEKDNIKTNNDEDKNLKKTLLDNFGDIMGVE